MVLGKIFGRIAATAIVLGLWYNYSGNPDRFNYSKYNDKKSIERVVRTEELYNLPKTIETKTGTIDTDKLDFSRDFEVETDRYKLVKEKDFFVSRGIGFLGCMPVRLFLWDYDVGRGINAEKSKDILAYLENNKKISGLTVRLGHNKALGDMVRLFSEKKLKERNNWFARVFLGIPICFKDEIWAEFFRGDYYNPLSRTAVCYSNIKSIQLHEIGHHEDFSRFSSDWEYTLARLFPPVMLYQEWKASKISKNNLKPAENYQFNRYLLPAFATYVLGTIKGIKKLFKRKEED